MALGKGFRYNVEGNRLYPSEKFRKMLSCQHGTVRDSIVMKRLGLLTRQLDRFEEIFVVDHSAPVTNENINIYPDRSEKLDLPGDVKKRERKISNCILEKRDGMIFNEREYNNRTINSVYWLLDELSGQFTDTRKRVIGRYCIKTGLFNTEMSESSNNTSNNMTSKQRGRNISLPHVGKL